MFCKLYQDVRISRIEDFDNFYKRRIKAVGCIHISQYHQTSPEIMKLFVVLVSVAFASARNLKIDQIEYDFCCE